MPDDHHARRHSAAGTRAHAEYTVTLPPDGSVDAWIRVCSPDLPQDVQVKFRVDAGRVVITGFMLDNQAPVTAASVRAPRLRAIEAALSRELRHKREFMATYRAVAEEVRRDPEGHHEHAHFALADADAWERRINEALANVTAQQEPDAQPFRSRGRGAAPPTEEELKAFAVHYLETLAAQGPRHVVRAIAEAHHMHRSTVYRWVKDCREPERQYLPPEETQ